MKIVLVNDLYETETIDIDQNTDFATFEMIAGSYVNIDPASIIIVKEDKIIKGLPTSLIGNLGVRDGDVLLLSKKTQTPTTSSNSIDFSGINPALLSRTISQKQRAVKITNNANLMDLEMQSKIEELIKLENIDSQMEQAMEHNPELFAEITMLYINCRINQFNAKAFVDSGAQITFISLNFARKCNLEYLIDKRYNGIAKGVGTQNILGRIHCIQLQIAEVFLQISVAVLEDQEMDILIGLDMLKRYQCVINLKRNVLEIGSYNNVETPFLLENELPDHAKLNFNNSD